LDGNKPLAWQTGITAFDNMTGGIMPGELVVIAAKSKGGKSTLALQWAKEWARGGVPVLVCSYEMSKEQLMQCLVSSEAGAVIRKDWSLGNDADLPRVEAAKARLAPLPLYLDASAGKRLGELEATCRLWHRKHGVRAFVVDYIQLIEANEAAERRDLEIAASSRRLKALAVNLNAPVIALSQLNDQGQTRESRTILHDSDMLVHIESPDPENCGPSCTAMLIVKASRSGPCGACQVTWQRGWRRFDQWVPPTGATE
jgi:replicative DNA helicase